MAENSYNIWRGHLHRSSGYRKISRSPGLGRYTPVICILTIIFAATAYAESFIFNVEYDGTDYSFGSGPDPLATDLNVGDDITYILTAADDDYWETTSEQQHIAFLSVTPPSSGSRVSTVTVYYEQQ